MVKYTYLLTYLLIYTKAVCTVKLLHSGHPRVLKNLSVINRCPVLGGSLTKIITFGTKHFVRYSRVVRYLGCSLLGGFTVLFQLLKIKKVSVIGKPLRFTFLGNFRDYYSSNLCVAFLQMN